MMRGIKVASLFAFSIGFVALWQKVDAFTSPTSSTTSSCWSLRATERDGEYQTNHELQHRRAFLSRVVSAGSCIGVACVTTGSLLVANVPPAYASGGATAGGVYLLSAKQRYNDRVIKGVKGYLALETSLKGGSVEEAKAFFAGEETGTWGDISTAAYLLANAFRRNSTASPDSLPSVKAWKAFVKELDTLQKKLKKKDAKGAYESFATSKELLDSYLALVELPPVMELK